MLKVAITTQFDQALVDDVVGNTDDVSIEITPELVLTPGDMGHLIIQIVDGDQTIAEVDLDQEEASELAAYAVAMTGGMTLDRNEINSVVELADGRDRYLARETPTFTDLGDRIKLGRLSVKFKKLRLIINE